MKLCSTYESCFLSNKVSIKSSLIKISLSLVCLSYHTISINFWSLFNGRHCFLFTERLRWTFFYSDIFDVREINREESLLPEFWFKVRFMSESPRTPSSKDEQLGGIFGSPLDAAQRIWRHKGLDEKIWKSPWKILGFEQKATEYSQKRCVKV